MHGFHFKGLRFFFTTSHTLCTKRSGKDVKGKYYLKLRCGDIDVVRGRATDR